MKPRKLKTPLRIRRVYTPSEGITDSVRITQARINSGLTQGQAARALGLSNSAYCKWESARSLKAYQVEGALAIFAALTPCEGITDAEDNK